MALPPQPLRRAGGRQFSHSHVHTGATTLLSLAATPPTAFIVLVSTGTVTLTQVDGSTVTETFPVGVRFDLELRGIQLAVATTRVMLLW